MPFAVRRAAGLIAGTTPTTGKSNFSAVLATDYKISFDNNQWQVTRLASNTTFTVTPDANGKVAFDGLELTFTGTPGSARSTERLISRLPGLPRSIAAAVSTEATMG